MACSGLHTSCCLPYLCFYHSASCLKSVPLAESNLHREERSCLHNIKNHYKLLKVSYVPGTLPCTLQKLSNLIHLLNYLSPLSYEGTDFQS